jgi:hypothetical protein
MVLRRLRTAAFLAALQPNTHGRSDHKRQRTGAVRDDGVGTLVDSDDAPARTMETGMVHTYARPRQGQTERKKE